MRHCFRAVVVFAVFGLAGCGSELPRGEVEGRLTSGGKPVPDMVVTFYPDSDVGHAGPRAAGKTDADGRFRIVTMPINPKDSYSDGAVVGPYRVCVADLREGPSSPSRIAAEFTSYHITPLKGYEIKPGAQAIDIEVPLKPIPKGKPASKQPDRKSDN